MNFVLHSLIVHTLKKYIQNFETFQLSLFQGEICLSKISVIQKSLNQFIASYTENLRIYKGNISKFKLIIPWSSLTSKSILITASDLLINLHFSHFEELLQAEKAFFGLKEEIKSGVFPEVDESLIQKFLNKVINNLRINFEKIIINIDLLDIYNLQIYINELEIYNCKEDGTQYEYIQSKKMVSKMIIFKDLRIKIITKTGKELEVLKFDNWHIKIFMKNEQYSFSVKNLNESNISLDLGLLNFFFERIPEIFFREKLKTQEQPIAFLLYNNIEMLKNSFQLKYNLEKVNINIMKNFEEELITINQSINVSNFYIEYISRVSIQKYCLNFDKIEFCSKTNLYLSLMNHNKCNYFWKFSKINDDVPFENNFLFEVKETKEDNSNQYQYDFLIIFSQINYFIDSFNFLNSINDVLYIYETFMNDLYAFLAKIQEKKEVQKKKSKIIDLIEEEKIDNLAFPPKTIYNYSIKFLRNRIEIYTNSIKFDQKWDSMSNYFIYFSISVTYKGILSRKSGFIKKFNFYIKPYELRLEDSNQVKIIETINSEIIYEKFEKSARISNLKILICELFVRTTKITMSEIYLLYSKINEFYTDLCSENAEKNAEKSHSNIDKDYQFNIQIKVMNLNFLIGEIIYIDINEPIKETFKEIFDVKLSKIEVFSMENASLKENKSLLPITNYKTLKLNFKIEIFFIDPLFFEAQNILNKVNVQLYLDFIDASKNKLEFLNRFQMNINPESLNMIFTLSNSEKNSNKQTSLVKYIKNETSYILYLKFHHFIKNEQIIIMHPGQITTLILSNKKFDSHLNFYQIGRKFHEDDEIPFYSDKFYIFYNENKSIKDVNKKIIITGFLQHEESILHLKTVNLSKSISSEVLCIFADWYLINLLTNQKLNLYSGLNKTNTNDSLKNENEKQMIWEITAKTLTNSKNSQIYLENLLKSNNKFLDLPTLIEEKLYLNQYNYHSSIEDFLDTSNEYLMSSLNEQNKGKFFHIFFKKNSNFKFLTYKLYSKIENDENPGKNLFYVDIFQKYGINFSVIKPFLLISNKIDKSIHLSLREYFNKDDLYSEHDEHEIHPECFYSICSSQTSNIYCTKLFFDFQICYHNLTFKGKNIVYKTYNDDKNASDSHILQFSNENSFAFDVILFNKKIEESSVLEFDYPLEISNESDYVIIIKIKKFIDPIIIQPLEKCKVLKHLNSNSENLLFSILQKGDLMFNNLNVIEVNSNDLFVERINLLSFNFTKLNEDYLNIFLSLSFNTEKEKQTLIIKSFLQIVNRTDNSLVLLESNRTVKPNETCSLEFKFSCDEEYNNKFIKVGKEYIKGFCQNLIRNKFFSESQDKEKIIKLGLKSLYSNQIKELILNEMITNNQSEIKFENESFVLGLYRNFFYQNKQLILYLVKNVIHDNKNYTLISNQTAISFSLKPINSYFPEKNVSSELINPFSSHLIFYDEKISTKSFKISEADQSSVNISIIAVPCLKYFTIRDKNRDNISFQIIIPNISVKFFLELENEINFESEIHIRFFQNDKFDILINKLKIEKNSKNNTYEILNTSSPPYIIMETNYFPEKNIMIFKNVYVKIDKLKFNLKNDTLAFIFKFIDQFYSMDPEIKNIDQAANPQTFQNINLDLLIFIYNLKIEEYKINLNILLNPHISLCDFNILIPVYKINNQKSSLKSFFNDIISFYLAHFVVQLPKTSITLNQLKNPFHLVTLIWNFKEKFMQTYSNFESFQPNPESILAISNIRFQLKYAYKLQEQLFLMLNSKKNTQSNSMKHLVMTNQFLYIITQGRVYKYISLSNIKKIKWCYSSKVINISSTNTKDLELLTTLRNGYRLVNVMKEILL